MTRDEQIIARWANGDDMAAIGAAFGITCQRVRQILKRAGVRMPRSMTVRERIEAGVDLRWLGHATRCWIWNRGLTQCGYGYLSVDGRKVRAHRAAFEAFRGPIPSGLVIDHLCRNPSCVNPDHLESVTTGENVRRGLLADLSYRRDPITHCPRGHKYTPANSHFSASGKRSCRKCRRLCTRAWEQRAGLNRLGGGGAA